MKSINTSPDISRYMIKWINRNYKIIVPLLTRDENEGDEEIKEIVTKTLYF